jgi:TRAP-type uncharacterized transport system fused permease subunit
MKIGFIATRIALAGYVIPFMMVYSPALMLQGGTWLDTAYVAGRAVMAIVLWGAAATGWLFGPMAWAERALATAAAFLLVVAVPLTDEAGFVLAITVIAVHYRRSRRLATKVPG